MKFNQQKTVMYIIAYLNHICDNSYWIWLFFLFLLNNYSLIFDMRSSGQNKDHRLAKNVSTIQ